MKPCGARRIPLISLRTQIYVGFAVIVSLLVAVGLIGYSGTTRLDESSDAMRRISDLNSAVLEVDRDVQELQMRVGKYMTFGHESMRHDVVELHDHLVALVENTARDQTDPKMLVIFDRISDHLPEYRKHFDAVIEERQIRTGLVQSQLPQQSEVIDTKLAELSNVILQRDQPDQPRLALLRCETMFSQAQQVLLRYYVAADTAFVDKALSSLDSAISSMAALTAHDETRVLSEQLIAELKEYKRIGTRAVQATRSYLYLVNVVMAGEASEVSYYSDRLRTLSESRRDSISATVASTAGSVRRMTGIGIAVTLILALCMAARLVMLILPPITALTSTFRSLASGETLVAIPETDRHDEIGEMAKAARVFSDQNRKQQELLSNAEQLTQELAAKAEELEKTNADLDSFAYVASHDLKSPLRGIRQLACWIEEDAGHLLPEDSVKHFQAMQSRVHRMELLLDDLLNFSRIGRTEAEPEEVDVAEMLNGIIDITDNPHGVVIEKSDALPTITTIRVPLEQVFLNLIGNAVKHNDKGQRGIVHISCENQDDGYLFSVCDNGPGIDAQHHKRVFQMYQRVGDSSVEGSGMGLAIVKKQIERQGGSIHLDSNPGQGVTFRFAWPATSV